MQTDLPQSTNKYLKAEMFQDQEIHLTYKGYDKKANEDRVKDGKVISTWKDSVKYQLRYSYPEWAINKDTGEKMTGKDGEPFKNRWWDPAFPHGYSMIYYFDEGQLESGSLPLWNEFLLKRPNPGDRITLTRTGEDQKKMKWKIQKLKIEKRGSEELPEIQIEDLGEDNEEQPF